MPNPCSHPEELLVYRDGPRRTNAVRRAYLEWRSRQKPPVPYRCDNETCVLHTQPSTWNGRPLQLILDHWNGVNSDNRPSNLRFLCPNCDAQNTETRGGANKGRVRKSSGGFAIKQPNGGFNYTLPVERGTYSIGGRSGAVEPAALEVHPTKEDAGDA